MQKKLVVALMVLALVFSLVPSAMAAKAQRLIIATAGVAGSYYPFGGAMARIWTSKLPELVSVAAQATGGAIENTRFMEMGEVELALTQNDLADYAWNSKYMFNKAYKKQHAIATLFPEVIHIFTLRSSGIKSFKDLAGKKVSMSPQGSGGLINSQQIFGHFGIEEKNLQPYYLSNVDAVDRMKDNLLDAIFITTAAPNAGFQDLCMAKDVELLGISGGDMAEIIKKYPFYSKYVIPKSDYAKQTVDIDALAVQAVLIASEDLSEDIVYALTKTLWESQQELAGIMAKAKYMDIKDPIKGITIPLHKGAEKYYKEIGVIK